MKYFWSDLHLSKEQITVPVGVRQLYFPSYKDWEDMVFSGLSILKKGDILIIGGDLCEKDSQYFYEKIKKLTKSLLIIVKGNHDEPANKLKKVFGEHFVHDVYETTIHDTKTIISHYPHLYWNRSHSAKEYSGSYHLYGHVHDQRTELINKLFPGIRSLDICPESSLRWLDEWRPFSEHDIEQILFKRKGHDFIQDNELFIEQQKGKLK